MTLFGTDGVRGKAGKKVTAEASMRLAMATGIYFKQFAKTKKILVGKDTRRSGYMIENAIVSGLTAVGFDVIQIGPMPTPAIAFLTESMRCDAGIMISASHNPYSDNGIKFFDCEGNKLNRDKEEEIEKIYNNSELIAASQATEKMIGKSKRIDDVIGRYIVHIKNSFPKHLTLAGKRIVIDCANGAAYVVGPTILQELGADVVVIGDEPNGFNINESCGAMHPEVLAKAVREYRADIGIALDGDADRLVVVDEEGEVIDGDKLMAVLAIHLHRQGALKGGGMVATVMSNKGLDEYLQSHNLTLHRSAVGDKHVVEMMMAHGMNFGGEQSGHIIFSDYAKTGDGLSSALQALAYLVSEGKKASEAFNPYESYPQMLVNLLVDEKRDFDEIEGLPELKEKVEKLGMRHLFRYSGTENKIRLLIEGKDEKVLEEMMEECVAFFKRALA
ncbi:phosphoglucosamine mutase [Sulfurovum sp.]|uniref:phosphoglucosamine mutase n=1 Tax=Sulfurovum sp. TaxID=1969726 RepID=UPI002A367A26|nr:phosphoglucosamine mutase [Sulfurovum sp.]MDD2451544.1 phosphoglucosamine mutase [Sulfurovum sp.]MDD3500099.1 phosphoglucosamine mutase [Sulfurovum sp.]MDY0402743.1 phosphoglucosamine mutase [Sulfurovum sp.]